jgi:hypothetical protein
MIIVVARLLVQLPQAATSTRNLMGAGGDVAETMTKESGIRNGTPRRTAHACFKSQSAWAT